MTQKDSGRSGPEEWERRRAVIGLVVGTVLLAAAFVVFALSARSLLVHTDAPAHHARSFGTRSYGWPKVVFAFCAAHPGQEFLVVGRDDPFSRSMTVFTCVGAVPPK